MISHCVLLIDQFHSIVSVEVYEPERSNKNESGIEINHFTMELLVQYTPSHIARRVVQVFAFSRILGMHGLSWVCTEYKHLPVFRVQCMSKNLVIASLASMSSESGLPWKNSSSVSGTDRKFRPVICLVYQCHMTYRFIYLSYICRMTLIYFPTKLMFLSCQVGTWHPSKLPIHTMSLYIRGDYFLKSYTVLKTAVAYDKYNSNICLVYAKIFMFFNQLCFYWRNNNEIATASLNQYVHMYSDARDITQSLEKHGLLSSHIW